MCTEIQRESFVRVGSELAHVRGTVFAPRGGGGNRNEDFLKALAHLVQQFAPDGGQEAPASKAKGKGKAQPHAAKAAGKGKPGAQPGVPSKGGGGKAGAMPKGKGDRQAEPARASEDDQLLAAVVRVVNRASAQGAQGLAGRLHAILKSASEGRPLSSGRAERRRRAKKKKLKPRSQQAIFL